MDVGERMKVRVEFAEKNDRAVTRVRNALMRYAPSNVEFVDDGLDIDILVMHINGRRNRTLRRIERAKRHGVKYVIMQYCLKSTLNKDVEDWMPIWEGAERVWSYYDLPTMAMQEECTFKLNFPKNFYHSPLGADSDVFKPTGADKKYLALSVSESYLSESTREVIAAVKKRGGKAAHLGNDLGIDGVDNYQDITDDELADLYSSCYYVSGLRRVEGQDLPAAEGLLCGARPIVFDRHDQADWYGEFSVVLPETNRANIIRDLVDVFEKPYEPVTKDEIEKAKAVFDWETIVKELWAWL